MKRALPFACCLLLVFVAGCDDGETDPDMDGGGGGMDGMVPPVDGMVPVDATRPPVDGDAGCIPTVEICGDRMDQNCDGRDTSCGDTDMDGINACTVDDTDLTMCDCDDSRTDVRPAFGTVPGAPEVCDGVDNNCNGRVDEAAECCAGCSGIDATRADICATDGTCVCSTGGGTAPCAEGQTCCLSGCVDTNTDLNNCGFCQSMCTNQSDSCTSGACTCGTGPPCDKARMCSGGSC